MQIQLTTEQYVHKANIIHKGHTVTQDNKILLDSTDKLSTISAGIEGYGMLDCGTDLKSVIISQKRISSSDVTVKDIIKYISSSSTSTSHFGVIDSMNLKPSEVKGDVRKMMIKTQGGLNLYELWSTTEPLIKTSKDQKWKNTLLVRILWRDEADLKNQLRGMGFEDDNTPSQSRSSSMSSDNISTVYQGTPIEHMGGSQGTEQTTETGNRQRGRQTDLISEEVNILENALDVFSESGIFEQIPYKGSMLTADLQKIKELLGQQDIDEAQELLNKVKANLPRPIREQIGLKDWGDDPKLGYLKDPSVKKQLTMERVESSLRQQSGTATEKSKDDDESTQTFTSGQTFGKTRTPQLISNLHKTLREFSYYCDAHPNPTHRQAQTMLNRYQRLLQSYGDLARFL